MNLHILNHVIYFMFHQV